MKLYFYNFRNGGVEETHAIARKNKYSYSITDGEYNNWECKGTFEYKFEDEGKVQQINGEEPYIFSSNKIEITDELKQISQEIYESKIRFIECNKNIEEYFNIEK